MLAITPGDVGLVDDDAAGLTFAYPPLATLGGLLLSRIARSFLRTLVCRCFLVDVTGTMSCMDLTRSDAALIVRSASEMDSAEHCAGYNLPTAVVIL